MRIQFYPSTDLENKLVADSKTLNVNVSTLVNDILNKHYGLIPPSSLTEVEIETKFFEELRAYVKNPVNKNVDFDLNAASSTYSKIDMVYAGKPHILKAQLGKKFATQVGQGDFANVIQVMNGKKPKRSVGNRAALYMIV